MKEIMNLMNKDWRSEMLNLDQKYRAERSQLERDMNNYYNQMRQSYLSFLLPNYGQYNLVYQQMQQQVQQLQQQQLPMQPVLPVQPGQQLPVQEAQLSLAQSPDVQRNEQPEQLQSVQPVDNKQVALLEEIKQMLAVITERFSKEDVKEDKINVTQPLNNSNDAQSEV